TDDDVREVRRMKARIERERLPAGDDPQFHLKLGRGSLSDIEFTAQLLQLQHGVAATGTMAALDAVAAAGALEPDDHATLAAAYWLVSGGRTPTTKLRVNGRLVYVTGHKPTVDAALNTARVRPRDGVLFSAVTHRVIDTHAAPAEVLLDDVGTGLGRRVKA